MKKSYRAWDIPEEEYWARLEEMADTYKVAFTRDEKHDTYIATATCVTWPHTHHGLVLSARAATAFEALKVLVYKHYMVLDCSWTLQVEREYDPADIG